MGFVKNYDRIDLPNTIARAKGSNVITFEFTFSISDNAFAFIYSVVNLKNTGFKVHRRFSCIETI